MVSYLKSSEKHTSNMLYIAFKLYSGIVFPNCVDFDQPGPKRGVVEDNIMLLKKDLVI